MMHHRCTSYGPNPMGPCTCGGALHSHAPTSSFPMMFENDTVLYPFHSPPSSVDCTLSLGTPSTRLSNDRVENTNSSFSYWDFLQTKAPTSNPRPKANSRDSSTSGPVSTTDSLLARRCANCDTTSTPLWRNGPRGPKSLCNACGIRYKKEERRANAANGNTKGAVAAVPMDHHYSYQNNSWVSSQKVPCYSSVASEFRFVDDNDSDAANISFLSWRLNVTDSPHAFTR